MEMGALGTLVLSTGDMLICLESEVESGCSALQAASSLGHLAALRKQ